MKTVELAWIAGIMDGEGCVHIRTDHPSETTRHRSVMHALVVKITMCHEQTIQHIHSILGFGHVAKTKPGTPNSQIGYAWYCMSGDAEKFLKLIQPYAVTKLDEISIALEFAALPKGRHGRRRVDPQLLQQRQVLCDRLKLAKPRMGIRGAGGHRLDRRYVRAH